MVYDCFTFFSEIEILKLRMQVLKDVVDKFVIVEATKTFTRMDHALEFAAHRDEFAEFEDRIIYVVVDDFPDIDSPWAVENHQRNCIARGLVGCRDDDTVMISDVDEIPNPDTVAKYVGRRGIRILEQLAFTYYLNCIDVREPIWGLGTRIMTYADFCHGMDHRFRIHYDEGFIKELNRGTTANKIRMYGHFWNVQNGGWHFSYIGGVDAIIRKIRSFSHQEYNLPEFTDPRKVEERMRKGMDLFDDEVHYRPVLVNDALPRYVVEHQKEYAKYILDGGELDAREFWKPRTWRESLSMWWDVVRHKI